MKRSKLLLPLMTLTPVAAIAPVVLSSCSKKKSSLSSLQYGDNYTLGGGDQSTAKTVAANHLMIYNSQTTIDYSTFLDALHPRQYALKEMQPVKQMDPISFYWEILYTAANNGDYLKMQDWKVSQYHVNAENSNYLVSFTCTWGTKNGSQIAWQNPVVVENASLPFYEVDKDGKVNYHFIATDTKTSQQFESVASSYSFNLVKVQLPQTTVFQSRKHTTDDWNDIIASGEIDVEDSQSETGAFYALATDLYARCDNQCTFTITDSDVSGYTLTKHINDDKYGIVSWSNLDTGQHWFTLEATSYAYGQSNSKADVTVRFEVA